VSDLEANGFIERKAGTKPALHAADAAAGKSPTTERRAKQYMIDYMYKVLGPDADTFAGRIEKCKTDSDLAGMIDPCRGHYSRPWETEQGRRVRDKVKELMG